MNRKEVLDQLDSLINNSKSFITTDSDDIWERDIKALKIAKKAVNKDYIYRFLGNLLMTISTLVVFSSLVFMAHLIYK